MTFWLGGEEKTPYSHLYRLAKQDILDVVTRLQLLFIYDYCFTVDKKIYKRHVFGNSQGLGFRFTIGH